MKRIRNILFIWNFLDWVLSFYFSIAIFGSIRKYSKDEVLSYMVFFAAFIGLKILFYLLKDPILKNMFSFIENIEVIHFQLKKIVIKPSGEDAIMHLTFVAVGKELRLAIKTNKKIGYYQEITYGTVRLKINKFYNISLFVKKYVNEYDEYQYYKEPVGIDHMKILEYEDYSIKDKKSIRPSLYIIK